MRRGTDVGWVLALFFGSGLCSLIDQVVWVRLLKLTFGNTVYASSVVVSVFLGGLALGAVLMGRYADRLRDRLGWYAALEVVAAISALAVPVALGLADSLYVWFFRSQSPGRGALLAVQVVVSAAVLLVPTLAMGSTLPLLARHVAATEQDAGRLVGRLYAVNTLGAAAGCALAGFVLVRWLGVWGALYTAAALNAGVVLAALALRRRAPRAPEVEVCGAQVEPAASTPESRVAFFLLLAALFTSGFVSIGYEIGWIRSVMFLLGGDTYVFSSVLTVYLLGNVLGAAIGSRIAPRLARPAAGFAVTLLLLGVSGVAYMPALVAWAGEALGPLTGFAERAEKVVPVSKVLIGPVAHSLSLFLVPAIVMGLGFPLALQAWAARVRLVGRSTGAAYGANTVGAVLGGIVTGFVLIPSFGVQISVTTLGLGAAWVATGLWVASCRPARLRRAVVPLLALGLSCAALFLPGNLLRQVMSRSPWFSSALETIDVREGVTTTVTVHRNRVRGTLHLYASGQAIAGDTFALRGDQKALGHFGPLLHPHARRVLSVGFGSGETTRCLSYHDLERIDCVEIAPEVVATSVAHFPHLNLGPRLDDEVHFVFMDAKNYLHLTGETYDVIVNDSIHPRNFSENASLYGREYFAAARSRLADDGLFVSWLPTYHMSIGMFDSILGTLTDVFPHVSVWYLTQHWAPLLVLVASDAPQQFDAAGIQARLEDPEVRDSLAVIGIQDAMDLLNCYVGDETDLRKRIPKFAVNSDLTPFVEFNTDPWNSMDEMMRHYVLEMRSLSIFDHVDAHALGPAESERWLARFRARHEAAGYLLQASAIEYNELEQLLLYNRALEVAPDDPAVLRARTAADRDLLIKGLKILGEDGPDRALALADTILKLHPRSVSAWLVRARTARRVGDLERALYASRAALALGPDDPEAQRNLDDVLQAIREAGGAAPAAAAPAAAAPAGATRP